MTKRLCPNPSCNTAVFSSDTLNDIWTCPVCRGDIDRECEVAMGEGERVDVINRGR